MQKQADLLRSRPACLDPSQKKNIFFSYTINSRLALAIWDLVSTTIAHLLHSRLLKWSYFRQIFGVLFQFVSYILKWGNEKTSLCFSSFHYWHFGLDHGMRLHNIPSLYLLVVTVILTPKMVTMKMSLDGAKFHWATGWAAAPVWETLQ